MPFYEYSLYIIIYSTVSGIADSGGRGDEDDDVIIMHVSIVMSDHYLQNNICFVLLLYC